MLKVQDMPINSKRYPRTPHLPFSPGMTKEDRIIKSCDVFLDKEIVITEKLDGSNVCMEYNQCFARSHASPPKHPSFDAFKAMHASIKDKLTASFQYFGEWLYAKHSISYNNLPNYFALFGIRWRHNDSWFDWNYVEKVSKLLEVPTVPVLFKGVISKQADFEEKILTLASGVSTFGLEKEGVVVRLSSSFTDDEFSNSIAKWVRKDHVQSDDHWVHKTITKNSLVR